MKQKEFVRLTTRHCLLKMLKLKVIFLLKHLVTLMFLLMVNLFHSQVNFFCHLFSVFLFCFADIGANFFYFIIPILNLHFLTSLKFTFQVNLLYLQSHFMSTFVINIFYLICKFLYAKNGYGPITNHTHSILISTLLFLQSRLQVLLIVLVQLLLELLS